jgi:TRAP-type C4-dicarboxylate transport system permease small subunit
MLLWIGFLGASVCVHTGQHLRIEAFDKLIPPRLVRTVRGIGFMCAAAFCLFLAMLGYLYVTGPSASTQSAQLRFPDRFSIVSVPIGLAFATIRFVVAAISAWRGGEYGRPVSEGDALAAAAQKHGADATEAAS